ncbi:hypothetical protein B9T64_06915 [Bacillus halotolerans]|uniref:hypothetical protein n=1 Tax=Bacillus halotolerans TaxID=260554 RepID=UPI000BFF1462|nr:hypothetical protein [Bacillus halotolerans]PHI49705.1 hypothetical protein B9T64_06915 [Bacillus halotolerans]
MKMERKLIGRVGVDSGQLLIIDPCYIDANWKKENESNIIGVRFWGSGRENAIQFLQYKNHIVESDNEGYGFVRTDNKEHVEIVQHDLNEFLKLDLGMIVFTTVNDGSYQEVCKLTMSEEQSGQYKNVLGCAFRSGFGDGLYEVYATYKDYGIKNQQDKRIAKVEIVLIEE